MVFSTDMALQTLEQVALFAGVDSAALRRLAGRSRLLVLRTGEVAACRGSSQTQLFIIRSGRLEICMHGRDGKRHMVRQLVPGEVFGLIPALDGGPAVHDADAHGTTELLQLPSDALLSELQTEPVLAMRLLQLLCSRSRQLYELLASSQLLSLDARVVRLILLLAGVELQGPIVAGHAIEIQMTQNDMSDMLGVSRQSLNTELKKLERQSLIKLAHARLLVVDAPSLERYASGAV